jgi:hypothetical protein
VPKNIITLRLQQK